MHAPWFARLGLVAATALGGYGCISPMQTASSDDTRRTVVDRRLVAQAATDHWSSVPALAARRLMEQYGAPDELRLGRMVWNEARPWKRIEVRDLTPRYGGEEQGVVAQTVVYPLDLEQERAVKSFDGKLAYDRPSLELTAYADREEVNILRLNLASEVARRVTSPEEARADFVKILALEAAGKSSPYMLDLRFMPKLRSSAPQPPPDE